MANSIVLAAFSLLPFTLSLFFFHVVVFAHAAFPSDMVSTICPRTRNPPFCFNLLKSARTTDLKGLTTFTLNLARNKATESRALAQSLVSKAANPKLKNHYTSCAKNYDNAAGDIDDAKTDLATGDYNGVNIKASAAMTETGDCQDSLSQPPRDPLGLSKNAKVVDDICSIILVIANLLLGRV